MKFPRPDSVSMTNGIICLGYEDRDDLDLAFGYLEAYGAGDVTTPYNREKEDGPVEREIDRLRLRAFKTNSEADRQAYFTACSNWFQDRHYRRMEIVK